jgi:cell wall assembly regulator SMI1
MPVHHPDVSIATFRRIKTWMETGAPDVVAQLRPGASDAELHEAEDALGFALPADLQELLRENDGSEDECGFWGFLQFVPASFLGAAREDLLRWVASDREYAVTDASLYPEVYPELSSDEWIAIGHQGYADQLALHAKTGRVFTAGKDVPALTLVAPSLAAYLDGYARDLEAGKYRVEEGFGGWYLEQA